MDSTNWIAVWSHGTRGLDRAGELFCRDVVRILGWSQMVNTHFAPAGVRDCGDGCCRLDVCDTNDFGRVSVVGDRAVAEQFINRLANGNSRRFQSSIATAGNDFTWRYTSDDRELFRHSN